MSQQVCRCPLSPDLTEEGRRNLPGPLLARITKIVKATPRIWSRIVTPADFVREICLRLHRPELVFDANATLFSDQAQTCVIDHWDPFGVPCVKSIQEPARLDIGPLPLAVILPDGTPGTAIAVSMTAAEKLVKVVRLIARFEET